MPTFQGNENIVALYAQGVSYRQKFYDRILQEHASHIAFHSTQILKRPLILTWQTQPFLEVSED